MKILITGATGFVGRKLLDYLSNHGDDEIFGTDLQPSSSLDSALVSKFSHLYQVDLRDGETTRQLIDSLRPNVIYHLAAQAHVPTALKDPWGTLETNIRGTLNLLEAMRPYPHMRIMVIGSADVYGIFAPEDLPLKESQAFNPGNPYSVSKVTQELLARQYYLAHRIDALMVRPFNHIGPGQNREFALPNFAYQISQMEQGLAPAVLRVGNLNVERDFTDVRDVVRAYSLLMEKGESGQVYNVCRGIAYNLAALVQQLIGMADVSIKIEIDGNRFRPVEVPTMVGDPTRLKMATGWQAKMAIETTLRDILADARQNIS